MNRDALDALAQNCGIEQHYWDIRGRRHAVSDRTKRLLLRAMHLEVDDEEAVRRALIDRERDEWARGLPPVLVRRNGDGPLILELCRPHERLEETLIWTLLEEGGTRHQDRFRPCDLEAIGERAFDGTTFVKVNLPITAHTGLGYHQVSILSAQEHAPVAGLRLIVVPDACYLPPGMGPRDRVWGPAVQLYALRSAHNWGMGDFTDLKRWVERSAQQGAGLVGLNPMHALFPHDPSRRSPYSPSTRSFTNTLYIDVEAVPDFAESEAAQQAVADPDFQTRLAALRDTELVNVAAVSKAKRSILEMLFEHFRERHIGPGTVRGEAFRAYQAQGGHPLWQHALFQALAEDRRDQDERQWGWPVWPAQYRDPASDAVEAFAREHAERVEFYQYVQWQAQLQLAEVGGRSLELGLKVGLYQDLAVGVDAGGLDTWLQQDLYALEARIGAPADDFHPAGQEWGLPPMIPHRLRSLGYQPFVTALRANMRHGGALRIDHVMGLMRLFWVPKGDSPTEGAYVRYRLHDLLGILALESQRNHCMVIGEDLGTVDDEVRKAMEPGGIHAYRVFYFTKDERGAFLEPEAYPAQALVTISTHDLPTLPGYWSGRDIQRRVELGLYPEKAVEEAQILERTQDRTRIMMALSNAGLLPAGVGLNASFLPELTDELILAIHTYLARTPARMMTFQLEDIVGQRDQVNLPGTVEQHPNWCRKLPITMEQLAEDERFAALTEALRRERGSGRIATEDAGISPDGRRAAVIPRATYRFQMSRRFTFDHVAARVPYLKRLGISHCYLSPILKARPGSLHGYDIIDHSQINPEIGSRSSFEHLVHVLKQHQMGLILDMVPNHMGIGSDNPWWCDVLEHGPASPYAGFFDIDWEPVKIELRGKVLLPFLEDHYGIVLERKLLRVLFDADQGTVSLGYHEHRFPIDPQTYPLLLAHGIERMKKALGPDDQNLREYLSLIDAFAHLPGRDETDTARVTARLRDQEVLKRHLVRVCAASEPIGRFIDESVRRFNGREGDRGSFDSLDRLLSKQAYRLAYWRVASDDINYRRFFDINDLAGLSMENRAVFEKTHRFILELIGKGQVQGLRIDHPDGLRDPETYCRWLQEAARLAGTPPGAGALAPTTTEEGRDAPGLYVALEKILVGNESLPPAWPVHGTTGYDFACDAIALLTDHDGEPDMERIYNRFVGRKTDFPELLHHCRKMIVQGSLGSELNVLATDLNRIAEADRHTRDFTLSRLKDALAEVVACFPVYRTYVTAEDVSPGDRRQVETAIARARARSQATDVSIYDFIARILLLDLPRDRGPEIRSSAARFAMRFQQYTGPVMAKGMEDTAFYIYNRLLSLNDVGSDPTRFGITVDEFHRRNLERRSCWPHSMLSGSTHDHKRSADVRARISVLAEIPDLWQAQVSRWHRMNRNLKRRLGRILAPSKNDEYAVYQTLAGAWPAAEMAGEQRKAFTQRIEGAMIKAVREAKVHSSWINVNPDYEDALRGFVSALLAGTDGNAFLDDFLLFQRRLSHYGMLNGLALTLLQLTSPGVPDIYQGDELWRYSLVDPDNRRGVDFDRRQALLGEIGNAAEQAEQAPGGRAAYAGSLFADLVDGRAKLFLIQRILELRAGRERLFREGEYIPLTVHGEHAAHLCAYARRDAEACAVIVAPRICAKLLGFEAGRLPLGSGVWKDTRVALPEEETEGAYTHLLTGESLPATRHGRQRMLSVADICRTVPLGLWVREPRT